MLLDIFIHHLMPDEILSMNKQHSNMWLRNTHTTYVQLLCCTAVNTLVQLIFSGTLNRSLNFWLKFKTSFKSVEVLGAGIYIMVERGEEGARVTVGDCWLKPRVWGVIQQCGESHNNAMALQGSGLHTALLIAPLHLFLPPLYPSSYPS